MLRNKDMQNLKPDTGEMIAGLTIGGFNEHRVAFFAVHGMTENFYFRRLPHMGAALEVLDMLDPNESDWNQPLLLTHPRHAKVALAAIIKLAERADGSWLSQEASLIVADRLIPEEVPAMPVPKVGEIAVQGVLF